MLSRLLLSDSYGCEINKEISSLSSGRFELKEATLYTACKRPEEAGYIASYWGGRGAGARRRYYTITPTGREASHILKPEWKETSQIPITSDAEASPLPRSGKLMRNIAIGLQIVCAISLFLL